MQLTDSSSGLKCRKDSDGLDGPGDGGLDAFGDSRAEWNDPESDMAKVRGPCGGNCLG